MNDIYAAYMTWPDDIRQKLSLHDLYRMNGWAPRTAIGDWQIDTSAGGPILTYKNCSVIEGEDARYVLRLIVRDHEAAAARGAGDYIAQVISSLQSTRERMMAALPVKFGDGFDGDFDTMRDAINLMKRAAKELAGAQP